MTKAQEQAARIEANRWDAYRAKVSTLTRQAFGRVSAKEVREAYDAKVTADELAARIAYREPVGAAVYPQKAEAVKDARARAQKVIDRVKAELEAGGWDRNAVAGYPDTRGMSKEQYKQAISRYRLFHDLTHSVETHGRSPRSPDHCEMSPEGMERFIRQADESAAFQYDAFTVKLVGKIGEGVTEAVLEGSHVWDYSHLTVTKSDGSKEVWYTQQIVNYSVYGTPYLQWPTRKLKS